jgi:transposase-like protein
MAHRRRFSAEYKREAVAMLDAPGMRVSQIAADLGTGEAGIAPEASAGICGQRARSR